MYLKTFLTPKISCLWCSYARFWWCWCYWLQNLSESWGEQLWLPVGWAIGSNNLTFTAPLKLTTWFHSLGSLSVHTNQCYMHTSFRGFSPVFSIAFLPKKLDLWDLLIADNYNSFRCTKSPQNMTFCFQQRVIWAQLVVNSPLRQDRSTPTVPSLYAVGSVPTVIFIQLMLLLQLQHIIVAIWYEKPSLTQCLLALWIWLFSCI